MVGQERSLLSLLATEVFGLAAVSAALTYIVAFGLTKAATNFLSGTLADRYGRKPVLVAGWLVGLPVPLLLIWAPTWGWIVAANVLLGINQGLCWSTTVIMKIDLAGPRRRGLAMGLNEAAGYMAVAVTAYLTGLIAARAGLRPGTVLPGPCLRRPRPQPVGATGPRDPRARPPRGPADRRRPHKRRQLRPQPNAGCSRR
jgi:MFS family permease